MLKILDLLVIVVALVLAALIAPRARRESQAQRALLGFLWLALSGWQRFRERRIQ